MDPDDEKQDEDDLASRIVSDVLNAAISQLVVDDGNDGRGDTASHGPIGFQNEHSHEASCSGDASGRFSIQGSCVSHKNGDGAKMITNELAQEVREGSANECHQREFCQHDATGHIADSATLERPKSTDDKVERALSTRSSRTLEVHIPRDAMNTAEYPEPHKDNSDLITRPFAPVSQSYPPIDPIPQDRQSPNMDIRSPPSRLIQLPLMGPPSDGSRRAVVTAAGGRKKLVSDLIAERQKTPPCVSRMSAVLRNTRARAEKQRSLSAFFEEKSQRKLLSLDQCINSRPPMPFDLDNPGPCRYSPPTKPLAETNSPKYTFGIRFYERGGGGRTAWAKSWFNSRDNQTIKVNFEHKWPSPAAHIGSQSLIGRKLPSKPTHPSFTFGARSKLSINKRGSEMEPSPNEYEPAKADRLMYRRAPAYGMTFRHKGTSLWPTAELTPAPDIYTPRLSSMSSKPHHPAFTIQGIRRPKSHALGPYATI